MLYFLLGPSVTTTPSAMRAEAILRHMQRLSRNGIANVKPDTIGYTPVISAWGRNNDPERNQDVRTYTAIIHAWSRSDDPPACEQAD